MILQSGRCYYCQAEGIILNLDHKLFALILLFQIIASSCLLKMEKKILIDSIHVFLQRFEGISIDSVM